MSWKTRPLVPVLASMLAVTGLLAVPAAAAPAATVTAANPIDDAPDGDPAAPGVNVIRNVSEGEVIVRLNLGERQAHFYVIVHGIEVLGIDDDFPLEHGVDGGWENGVWGGCADELIANLDASPFTALARLYTCSQHDTFRLHLGEIKMCPVHGAAQPAIRIAFREMAPVNVDGVFVGDDPTDVGRAWIPLYE